MASSGIIEESEQLGLRPSGIVWTACCRELVASRTEAQWHRLGGESLHCMTPPLAVWPSLSCIQALWPSPSRISHSFPHALALAQLCCCPLILFPCPSRILAPSRCPSVPRALAFDTLSPSPQALVPQFSDNGTALALLHLTLMPSRPCPLTVVLPSYPFSLC